MLAHDNYGRMTNRAQPQNVILIQPIWPLLFIDWHVFVCVCEHVFVFHLSMIPPLYVELALKLRTPPFQGLQIKFTVLTLIFITYVCDVYSNV